MADVPDTQPASDTAPSGLGKRSGVRRVNNVPLYVIGGIAVGFIIVIMLVGIDRAHRSQGDAKAEKEKSGDSSQLAKSIIGSQTDGFVPAANSVSPSPASSLTVPIAIPDDLEKPPMPPSKLKQGGPSDPDSAHINQEKMQRFESAVTGKTTVPFTMPKTSDEAKREQTLQRIDDAQQRIADLQQQGDANTTFKTRLAQLQGGGGLQGAGQQTLDVPKSQRNDVKQFDSKGQKDRWKLDAQVEAPKTPYTLRAGFVIPASLISGINSDLPGQIIGQISQDVYDTASGKYLLIPQGSRLVGSYTSDVAYGQSRVMVAWQRIVYPDGKTLDIGAMPGADGAGYSGFSDQVNNHYLRLFGSAILMSGITAGVSYSQNSNNNINGQPTASSALSEALGQQLGNVTAQMISKNLNISPTLEIRPGFRFNVMCIKDLVMTKPYSSFDY